ncbi:uncharacterized protein LOC115314984 [Ixodes scapularis]|uniref:uncharacterized protein LOC115314984 n=1 Tax=Ixodes scapularis TaxID=6945 RepID=UPI001161986D|nr:uncharacterized protein LOC115314984 [Ixodes scapularis]
MQSLKQVAKCSVMCARNATTAAAPKAGAASSRRMKFPYTFTAKLVQFPYKFHYNNMWLIKFMVPAWILYMVFIVRPIHKAVNSPAAVAAHKELMRKQAQEHAHGH